MKDLEIAWREELLNRNVYQENGYENRKDYLEQLADEYDCPIETVYALADVLGEDEDFDGLVSAMRDYEEMRDCE